MSASDDPLRAAIRKRLAREKINALAALGITSPTDDDPDASPRVDAGTDTRAEAATTHPLFDDFIRALLKR